MKYFDYAFPLTRTTGKIRLKERSSINDYGRPVAPTQTLITSEHYIEWQIGYDRVVEDGEEVHFKGVNGKNKQIYELSEILLLGLRSMLVSRKELESLREQISANDEFIAEKEKITRERFAPESIGGMEFLRSRVGYPLILRKFELNDAICEIVLREKQYAVGVMPMLYFCIPMSSILDKNGKYSFVGRKIASRELGYFRADSSNIKLFMEMFHIFGILSRSHNCDCVKILDYILGNTD